MYLSNMENILKKNNMKNFFKENFITIVLIITLLNEYTKLNNAENENQIVVTKNYYNYLIYLLIVIFLGVLLFKFSLIDKSII